MKILIYICAVVLFFQNYGDTTLNQEPEREIARYPQYEKGKFDAEILTPGTLHGEEVSANAADKKWFGFFQSSKGTYKIQETKLSFTTVVDPILGESEEDASAVKIQVEDENRDAVIALIEGMDCLKNSVAEKLDGYPKKLDSGESYAFTFHNQNYKLSAVGMYELFLESNNNGKIIKTLVSSTPFFDEGNIDIMFVGDIDQDGKIDLVLNNSPKYNAFTPTIYLSSVAGENELVKIIGMGRFLGC